MSDRPGLTLLNCVAQRPHRSGKALMIFVVLLKTCEVCGNNPTHPVHQINPSSDLDQCQTGTVRHAPLT